MHTDTFHVSVVAPNATMVVYGILVAGMHPIMHIIWNSGDISHKPGSDWRVYSVPHTGVVIRLDFNTYLQQDSNKSSS